MANRNAAGDEYVLIELSDYQWSIVERMVAALERIADAVDPVVEVGPQG